MAIKFKGDTTVAIINSIKKAEVDTVYRCFDSGVLLSNEVINHGDFVSWDGTKWIKRSDLSYLINPSENPIPNQIEDIKAVIPEGTTEENPLVNETGLGEVAERVTTAEGDIDSIEGKIPSGASSSNKLVTESDLEAAQDSWQSGFTPKGEATVSQIDALTTQSNGDQYIVTDSGTITAGSVAVVAGDTVAWNATDEVWYKVTQYAKASEQAALTAYAQNVAHSIAPEFVPNETNAVAGLPYMHGGELYVARVDYNGVWDESKFIQISVSSYMDKTKTCLSFSITYISGKYIHYSNGTENNSNDYSASDYIYIRPAKQIRIKATGANVADVRGAAFYSASKSYISGYQYEGGEVDAEVSVPADAEYIRFTCKTTDLAKSSIDVIDLYDAVTGNYKSIDSISPVVKKTDNRIEDIAITWTDGKYINYLSGVEQNGAANSASDYIDVENIACLGIIAQQGNVQDARGLAFYDESKVYISGYQYPANRVEAVVTVPLTAKYVRFTTLTDFKSVSEVYRASVLKYKATPYWEDGQYIKGTDGSIGLSSGQSTATINVACVASLSLTHYGNGTVYDLPGYAFYDVKNNVISCAKYSVGAGYTTEVLNVPANAYTFKFTSFASGKKNANAVLKIDSKSLDVIQKKLTDLHNETTPVMPTSSLSMFEDFAVCGDSYSAGSVYGGDPASFIGDFPKIAWGHILAKMNGVSVSNYSSRGADTRSFRTRSECLPALLADAPKDLYIMCLGINDYGYGMTLGSMADIDDEHPENNADTYYGNYGYILQMIKNHAPDAKLIISKVFIPVSPVGDTSAYYTYSSTAIEELASHYHCIYAETMGDAFFTSSEYISGKIGAHPTAALYSGMAQAMNNLLGRLIFVNYNYFADYMPT